MKTISRLLGSQWGIRLMIVIGLLHIGLWVMAFARVTPELPDTYTPVTWYDNVNAEDIRWVVAGPFALEEQTRRPWVHTPFGWVSPAAPVVQDTWIRTHVKKDWF